MIQEYELSLLGIIRKITISEEFKNALKERCLSESNTCVSFCFFSEDREVQLRNYNMIVNDIKDLGDKSTYFKEFFIAIYECLIRDKEYLRVFSETDHATLCSVIKYYILVDIENVCGNLF